MKFSSTDLHVVKVHKNKGVTRDLRPDHVCVYADDFNNVDSAPQTG